VTNTAIAPSISPTARIAFQFMPSSSTDGPQIIDEQTSDGGEAIAGMDVPNSDDYARSIEA